MVLNSRSIVIIFAFIELPFFWFYIKLLNQRALLSGPIHVAVPLALVVGRLGNAINWINFHPLDNAVRFAFSYLLRAIFLLDSVICLFHNWALFSNISQMTSKSSENKTNGA